LRGWQAALVLGSHADRATAAFLLPELFFHLRVPHVPDVRDYQELLGCVLCARFGDLAVEPLLVPALQEFNATVQVSASLLTIACYLLRHWNAASAAAEQRPPYVRPLLLAIVPYLAHNSAHVRGTAAWALCECFSALGPDLAGELAADGGGGGGAALLGEVHRFLLESRECQKMHGRLKPVFMGFDPGSRTALSCLIERSEVLPSESADKISAGTSTVPLLHIFADSEFQPTGTFAALLKDEVAQEMDTMWDRSDPSIYPSSSEGWSIAFGAYLQAAHADAADGPRAAVDALGDAAGDAAGGVAGLQRKFKPLAPPVPPSEHSSPAASGSPRMPLVLIASLVDKTPNLAGLCRTSEVFNCEALCLPNLKLTKDLSFQSISVSAEKWLPIREVPKSRLRSQLLDLRRRGYALIGIEQTHNSVPLDQWHFAPNTALVLGAEKEGIDADTLQLLDACLEIPQAGQLRSLNVHVSGSLAIWEYTRQRRALAAPAAAGRG